MSYTLLRVVERGVVFFEGHARRLAAAGERFRAFARDAEPGVYALTAVDGELVALRRPGSRLHDGMAVRYAVSPVAGRSGPLAKPAPPSSYDGVRAEGIATLLTSPDGLELYEACSAAIVAWDGRRFVVPPRDRPRVASVSEAVVRACLPLIERPILRDGTEPLVLINAVAGVCAIDAARPSFPGRAMIEAAFARTVVRPAS